MQTVLVYHTCEHFFASVKTALASNPLHIVHCNNYNKVAFIDSVACHAPHYVLVEKRTALDVMELLIEKAKFLVPSSTFILVGADATQCLELRNFFPNNEYHIANEQAIHQEIVPLFQKETYFLEQQLKDKALYPIWKGLTETEKRIVDVVTVHKIMHVKDISNHTSVASYDTLRTHLKNIYRKLNIHHFQDVCTFFTSSLAIAS